MEHTRTNRFEMTEDDNDRLVRQSELALAISRTIGAAVGNKTPVFGKTTTLDIVVVLTRMSAEFADRLVKESAT